MCKECGCGLPGEDPVGISAHHQEHEHRHGHEHAHEHEHVHEHDEDHDHEHQHEHEHGPGQHHSEEHNHAHTHPHSHIHSHGHSHAYEADEAPHVHRTLEVQRAILGRNDRLAERNRGFFRARGLLVLNLLSSPGSGKTTFLRETIRLLNQRLRSGIIVGDLATDNDAQRLRETHVPVMQITTGTMCHLEAEMIARAVNKLDLNGLELLIIENVGNLVCPASYDLGEDLRVVLLSVTEGEDKPLKYPPMFQTADVVIVSKIDLTSACDYDRNAVLANLRRTAPKARVFEVSAKTGQGMEAWLGYLLEQQKEHKGKDPLAV
jgi:hydrogenase nickel incorporation protein HypB